jgi:hypothetical protein
MDAHKSCLSDFLKSSNEGEIHLLVSHLQFGLNGMRPTKGTEAS